MEVLWRWWKRARGWWLLTAAAAVTAVFAAIAQLYSGILVAIVVAAGGAVAGVFSDRGRAHLAARVVPEGLYIARVDRLTDPLRLGVHRAAVVGGRAVPPFVVRDRLPDMVAALRAAGFVLVVGDSTAGKTRLAFEAMKTCLPRHVCVVPGRKVAPAVSAAVENRPSVLWLDDLDRYLGVGGLTLDDLRTVVAKEVVVLATIRTHERERLSERHDVGRDHVDQQLARAGREILGAVTTEIRLPRRWSSRERAAALAFADDPRVAAALANADRHGLAEYMAAGPELVRDLTDARDTTRRARGAALVTAAIELRRAGYHRPVPGTVLAELHETYLAEPGRAESWAEALDWATRPLHATSSLLEPMGDDTYLAFDYLLDMAVQDRTTSEVPNAVWHAVVAFADPISLVEVAWEAELVGQVGYLRRATAKALDAGDLAAAATVAELLGDSGHEDEAADHLARIIAVAKGVLPPVEVLRLRRMLAWQVGEKVGGRGDPRRALAISSDIVRESEVVLGAVHPDTLAARVALARQCGAVGERQQALGLAEAIVEDATRELGPGEALTLEARFEVAVWTRAVYGADAGIEAFSALLRDIDALVDVSPWLITNVRWNLGGALVDASQPDAAVEILEVVVASSSELRGRNHVTTMDKRLTHIGAVRGTGAFRRAAELADELARNSDDVLGPIHVITLEARGLAAACLAESGDWGPAEQRYEPLLADLSHLPDDHWLTTQIRADHERLHKS